MPASRPQVLKSMVQKYPENGHTERANTFSAAEREALIVRHADLVRHTAIRMSMRLPSSVTVDELMSAGSIGLIDAVDKFDPAKDVSFRTYAQFRIKGAILDELRSMDWYSRSMRKKIQDVERAVVAVEAREGRPAGEEEVARELGVGVGSYQDMLTDIHGAALLNLDAYIRDDENDTRSGKTFQDQIRSDDNPEENVGKEELKGLLVQAIQSLSEKEQLVLSLYYFEDLTLKEIGEVVERTESRICQIHSAALVKLRSRLKKMRAHAP